ncbi:OPT oligopeptide transporter protein-domain-containing protein [Lipomyces arxii]|uniref:OPT oligopeptide transporter protein-domain-containing protein n=1 Tax=Lipomyces arxii TaxID=56418 RepID=UPI0034D01CB0
MSEIYEDKAVETDEKKIESHIVTTETDDSSSNDYSDLGEKGKAYEDPSTFAVYDDEIVLERMVAAGDMDDILAEGDGLFFVEKLKIIGPTEAYDVLKFAIEYHRVDINFPAHTMNRILTLLKGEEAWGQGAVNYDLDLRLEATMMKFHSPYPEVRAVCKPTDDPSIPVETFRAYFIGIIWVAAGSFINQLMYFRQPHFTLSSQVVQLLLLPCGQFAARVLPAWKFKVWKYQLNLNPGPWTFKEQMFATIITNVGAQNSVWGQYFPVIREKIFYNQTWATIDFTILMNIVCQLFGLGMSGVLRRWAVYPSKAVWPTILPTLQLNRTLLVPEQKRNVNGWTISKYKLFNILLAVSFVYFFIPDYLFTALSTFNWMTWIAPKNKTLAYVTGSTAGVGFNPLPTFDWAVINYATPMVLPFFTSANQYIGTIIGAVIVLILVYTNSKFTAYVPPNTSTVFDRFQNTYNLSRVLDSKGVLDVDQYRAYSPPYVSAGYYMYLCVTFVMYTFAFVYIFLNETRTFKEAIVGTWRGLRKREKSMYSDYKDPLSVFMREYKEVPDWWFFSILAISFALACIIMKVYPTTTPVWVVVCIFLVAVAMLIPFMVLYASTGAFMSTNNLGTILGGYMNPGNGVACVFTRALGYVVEDQAETYVGDQKLAHYSKLPPRAVFRGQIVATIVQIFVTAGAMELAHGVVDFCSFTQPARFYCAWSHSIYTGSLLFGVVGPNRTFDTLYPLVKWCFLMGALFAVPLHFARQRYPQYLRYFHPVLILSGLSRFGSNYNLTYYTSGFYLSFVFMYYIRTRYLTWWSKYNYIITSGISAGIAFSGILIFLALQYRPKHLVWWGNTVAGAGVDGAAQPLKVVDPAVGYFGMPAGSWK